MTWRASWRYRDGIEFNPHRLAEVEERVHLIHGLQRKYGDTIADVLAYGERAAAELEAISHAEERIAGLEAEEVELLVELGRLGAALSAARRAAGERMARAIEAELADLQMAKARFAASISWTQDSSGALCRCRFGRAWRVRRLAASASTATDWTPSPSLSRPTPASR